MRIPSMETRQDMRAAAELRAAGATWETIAVAIRRQPNLLARWAKIYCEGWLELLAGAEERQTRLMDAESRATLRNRLRGKELKARLEAAQQLLQQVPDDKPAAPPSAVTNPAGFSAYLETLNDDDCDRLIDEVIDKCRPRPTGK
jgi:hypothetical protein